MPSMNIKLTLHTVITGEWVLGGSVSLTKAIGSSNRHFGASSLECWIEGGTGLVSYGELASLIRQDLSGLASTGLARWSYMTFSGNVAT